jgi:hypothetical protein
MELAHVGKQGVLVREEHLRARVIGPGQVAEHQVEPGGALRHVREDPVEAGQLPVHLGCVAAPGRLREGSEVGQDVRKDEPG